MFNHSQKNFLSLALSFSFFILILTVPQDWNHGCTRSYDENGDMVWEVPENASSGDLLLLFMSRTDDVLPLEIDEWTYGASCFKTGNGQKRCWTLNDCDKLRRVHGHCMDFPRGRGLDLATVIFYKKLKKNNLQNKIRYNIYGDKPGWGFLLAVKGVNTTDPIRSINESSADGESAAVFPSVYGEYGDLLLLSLAFDDKSQLKTFLPPDGMESIGFINGEDEAGYLFSKAMFSDGYTGAMVSEGKGGNENKDALISIVLKGNPNFDS